MFFRAHVRFAQIVWLNPFQTLLGSCLALSGVHRASHKRGDFVADHGDVARWLAKHPGGGIRRASRRWPDPLSDIPRSEGLSPRYIQQLERII